MCSVDWCDGTAIVLADRSQRAIKAHKCTECGRAIRIGEVYQYQRTVYDGQAQSHKVCTHCQAAREWFDDQCGGWTFGGLAEDAGEHECYGGFWRLIGIGVSERWTRANGDLWPVPRAQEALQRLKATAAGGEHG